MRPWPRGNPFSPPERTPIPWGLTGAGQPRLSHSLWSDPGPCALDPCHSIVHLKAIFSVTVL